MRRKHAAGRLACQKDTSTKPTYVHMANYTLEGLENIGEHGPQPEVVIKSLGAGELKALYLTIGKYDVVHITEFPDDETATQFTITMAQGRSLKSRNPQSIRRKSIRGNHRGTSGVANPRARRAVHNKSMAWRYTAVSVSSRCQDHA